MRSRLALGMTCAAVLALFIPSAISADSDDWDIKLLTSPSSWERVYPNNLNRHGKIVGFWEAGTQADGTYEIHAICWEDHDSSPVELEELPGDDQCWAADVNKKGMICGSSGGGLPKGVIWDAEGDPKNVHPEGDEYVWSQVWSLDDKGNGCGSMATTSGMRPWYWSEDGTSKQMPFDTDDYWGGIAFSVNEMGMVSGMLWDKSAAPYWSHAVFWTKKGELVEIHDDVDDAVDGDVTWSFAWEATDVGEIAGECGTTDGDVIAWVWSKDGVEILDADDELAAVAWQSDGRFVVGAVGGDSIDFSTATASVWVRDEDDDEVTWTLEKVPALTGYDGMITIGANKKGEFAGAAAASDGTIRAWYAEYDDDD